MIIEGLVTTVGPAGACHVAPMGPRFENSEWDDSFELAPFQGSATLRHLVEHPEGVFHLDDRVMLFAHLIVGGWGGPVCSAAEVVAGWVVQGVCRAVEFRVEGQDLSGMRSCLSCRVMRRHEYRAMSGFNRAKHAVVEAAILASRRHMIQRGELESRLADLYPLVSKTGGSEELQAFALLRSYALAGDQVNRQVAQ